MYSEQQEDVNHSTCRDYCAEPCSSVPALLEELCLKSPVLPVASN